MTFLVPCKYLYTLTDYNGFPIKFNQMELIRVSWEKYVISICTTSQFEFYLTIVINIPSKPPFLFLKRNPKDTRHVFGTMKELCKKEKYILFQTL